MIRLLSSSERAVAQAAVTAYHYLRKPVDARCSVEAYSIDLFGFSLGYFLLGRAQATRCYPWYGSVDDVASGRAEVTRWQVLNLARVWLSPEVQPGGWMHDARYVPGFTDRRGVFRSTLPSRAIAAMTDRVVVDYLLRRPPCFLNEPYELRWLLSYCDTRLHRGVLYRAAGFELYSTNAAGVQTWRLPLRPLTAEEHAAVREASFRCRRARRYRAERAQQLLQLAEAV